MSGVKTVFGGGTFGLHLTSPSEINQILDKLEASGITTIDTAQIYQTSESTIGDHNAGSRFTIDTKQNGGRGSKMLTKGAILKGGAESLAKLKMKQVNIFYIHAPDADHDLEDTLDGINELYKTGAFKRFGLSNYSAAEVQRAYDICKKNSYVLPTAYQGLYNPVSRRSETELFPTLRSLGISFYAYSPTAGGFLTQAKSGEGSRYDSNNERTYAYRAVYNQPAMLAALTTWNEVARDAGVAPADLANRWAKYHSALNAEHGDAAIVGARTMEHVDGTLKAMAEGKLDEKIVKRINAIWEGVKGEAPPPEFIVQ